MLLPDNGLTLQIENKTTSTYRLGNAVLTRRETQLVHFRETQELRQALKLVETNKIKILSAIPQAIISLLEQEGVFVPAPVTPLPPAPTYASKLADLSDVDVTNKAEGYTLQYDEAAQKFVSKAQQVTTGDGSTIADSATNGNILLNGAEVTIYAHPTNHPASMITEETNKRFMTDAERTKLTGLSNYTHPTNHPASMITEETNKRFMTDAERTKLTGLSNYTHPTNHPATMITQDATHRFVSDTDMTNWNALINKVATLENKVAALEGNPPPTNTAPTVTSSFNTTSVDETTSVSIPYTLSDTEGGDLTVTLTKDGTPSTQTLQAGSHTWNVGVLTVGSHTLKIKVADSGGLISTELTFNLTVLAAGETVEEWSYDFVMPQGVGTFDLTGKPGWTYTLTLADVYGPNMDGQNPKMELLMLGVEDGTKDEPGQPVPRDGFDVFAAPSMHGKFEYDDSTEVITFDSGAMNPYYFRIVKYL